MRVHSTGRPGQCQIFGVSCPVEVRASVQRYLLWSHPMTILPAERTELAITGMTCASCVRTVETALGSVPGVAGADVNLANERASVRLAGPVAMPDLVKAVERAGYGALVIPQGDAARSAAVEDERALRLRYVASLRRRLILSASFGTVVVLLAMVLPFVISSLEEAPWRPYVLFLLATPIQL